MVKAVLAGRGYAAAQDLLGTGWPAPLDGSDTRLSTLRRLFWRGDAVPERDATNALAPIAAEAMVAAGLLQRVGMDLRALFQIQVYDGLFFLADFLGREQPSDLVLPIGPSGLYLASLTIRRPVDAALDLGCGTGIQALLISRHAKHVVATDINPRALATTQMNAAMNGICNVETLEGSYFEPAAGRAFDLVVGNLPYVITPEKRFTYRDLGSSDDLPMRRNVEQAAVHLNEGGFAHLMLNWIHAPDQPWHEPVEGWTKRRNVDAWLIYSSSKTPQRYVRQWMTIDEQEEPEAYARTVDAWLRWYAERNIQRLAFGAITLRRRTATNNWRCSLQVSNVEGRELGAHMLHLFDSQDYLAKLPGPHDLLRRRLRPRFMIVERRRDGQWFARTTRSMLVRAAIGNFTAKTLVAMDGKQDLSTCIRKALRFKPRGHKAATDLVVREVYHLMELGMVESAA